MRSAITVYTSDVPHNVCQISECYQMNHLEKKLYQLMANYFTQNDSPYAENADYIFSLCLQNHITNLKICLT
jgi:hypothetical protein